MCKKENQDKVKRKGDDTMAVAAKPKTGAFVLRSENRDKFFSSKENGSEKAMDRFLAHHPNADIVNPFKK